jgi:hypothetical protein
VVRDLARLAGSRLRPLPVGPAPGALEAAVDWLCRTHEATGELGSSKGYSLLHGWFPAYPETTGYVLGTLLEYARRRSRPDLVKRAVQMADWEKALQEEDGGIMEGHVETAPRRSIVFNTGQVLHGWVDLIEAGYAGYAEAAARAAHFLTEHLGVDGTWDPQFEYGGIAHTYNSRVAWAMVRWALHADDGETEAAARRQLDWTCESQRQNGWFDNCTFVLGSRAPTTHAIAYTMRGLLESACLLGNDRWLTAVLRAAEALLPALERHDPLPAEYSADWSPAAAYSCLTGTVQLGGVWLRLYQETDEERWLQAGLRAVEQAAAHQERLNFPPVQGAISGSYPIWGRYAPLQYPNWATKFLADGLLLYDDCLTGSEGRGVASVTPGPTVRAALGVSGP